MPLKLEIVTPEAKVYSEDVDMVTLPGVDGELGIYPGHVPLLTQVHAGELAVRRGAELLHLAVGEGFVEVSGKRVAVMTDMAIKAEDIDEAQVEQAKKRAEARLQEKLGGEEQATVQAALLHSLTQLNVKRRRQR